MKNNQRIYSTDIINTLQSDPNALATLVSIIESGAVSVDQVATYAAMLPQADIQIEYSLVLSFNEINNQTEYWMPLQDVIKHVRAFDDVPKSVSDTAIEYFMDNSKYIDNSFEFGRKHYRMKSYNFEFDAVDILWGRLVDLLGKAEANRLFLIAQQKQGN